MQTLIQSELFNDLYNGVFTAWGPPGIKIWGEGAQVTTDKYTVYTVLNKGRLQNFGSRGNVKRISNMNSSQVLYCNGVSKISVQGGHSAQSTHQRLL